MRTLLPSARMSALSFQGGRGTTSTEEGIRGGTIPEESWFTIPVFGESGH